MPARTKAVLPTTKPRPKADRKGIWKGCFVAPQDFRLGNKDGALLGGACPADKDKEIRSVLFPEFMTMPPRCTIKAKFAVRARVTGNVGIYHLQGCRSYPATTKPGPLVLHRGRRPGRGIPPGV